MQARCQSFGGGDSEKCKMCECVCMYTCMCVRVCVCMYILHIYTDDYKHYGHESRGKEVFLVRMTQKQLHER